jgi:hypothetical protein
MPSTRPPGSGPPPGRHDGRDSADAINAGGPGGFSARTGSAVGGTDPGVPEPERPPEAPNGQRRRFRRERRPEGWNRRGAGSVSGRRPKAGPWSDSAPLPACRAAVKSYRKFATPAGWPVSTLGTYGRRSCRVRLARPAGADPGLCARREDEADRSIEDLLAEAMKDAKVRELLARSVETAARSETYARITGRRVGPAAQTAARRSTIGRSTCWPPPSSEVCATTRSWMTRCSWLRRSASSRRRTCAC